MPTIYDETKRFAEAMTMAFNRCHTFGPRMRPDDGHACLGRA